MSQEWFNLATAVEKAIHRYRPGHTQAAEIAEHARLRTDSGLEIYFADQHKPLAARHGREHQRPASAVLPKGTDLSRYGPRELDAVAATGGIDVAMAG